MLNPDLARDYIRRAAARLRALDVLYEAESWAAGARKVVEVVQPHVPGD